ncbi:MAG TPA: NAD(P)-dependent oxidoreductase [Pyrinomonadaceae bacterium]|jgi:nucleoside-diphosphate-sugar epimerase|nr:NAD(P)-dependent oxidoreductase [Pyrinomonadaceae bacterium]
MHAAEGTEGRERRCAVTGASGYLGSRLAAALKKRGWVVYELTRAADASERLSVPFTLASGAPPGFFREEKIDALVHCAYDFGLTSWRDIFEHNVKGSIRLLETVRAEGVGKVVFISTMSAFEGCRSLYGRAKLEVEREALRLGAVVVRPGLVYGERPGAMVGALVKAVELSPLVPLVGGGRQVLYPAHEDDVAELVHRILGGSADALRAPVIAASERGMTLREILTALAAGRRKKVWMVPVPWRLHWALLKSAEAVGLRPRFRSDSVLSLVNQDTHPDFAETRKAGVTFRDFDASPRE